MRGKLQTVEAARGLAALAVVFFHANVSIRYMGGQTFDLLSIGESGVDFFFVLSGFIIAFVHGHDIGEPGKAANYAAKRFIRLFPLLWVIVGGWLLVRLALGETPAIGTSLLLYPSNEPPTPITVWTLRHEVLFYCAFAVLILSRKAGGTLFAAWLAACVAQVILSLSGKPIMGLTAFFISSYSIDFMLGMGVAQCHRFVSFKPSWMPFYGGCFAVVCALCLRETIGSGRFGPMDYTSVGATWWTLLLGCAFALLLHGLLCIESLVSVSRPLVLLGASSYSLYLIHTPLNSVSQHVAVRLPVGLSHLLLVAISIVGGWLLHTRAERPVAAFLRGKLDSGARSPAKPTSFE